MRINTNLTAMNTYTQYTKNNNKIAGSVAKLSSGYAINSASDNAAGLAISEKMRAQIRGLDQASTNAQDAISLTQTAEGSLSESTEILQRMRELSVQSSNDTNQNGVDREALQDEFSQLQSELNDISKNTSFNKKNLLDGSLAKSTATLSNVSLAKSGLSVELGNVASGNYGFSVNIKQESAAITGKQSDFTATSDNDEFIVGSSVTNNIPASSLANGNYSITASYDTANDQMTFTAVGDNDQTFTATLTSTQLKDGVNNGGSPAAMTLNFKNGTTDAFSFTLTTKSSYDTTSDTTMTSLATNLTKSLSLSASGGVDAQDATYGVYASLTGADDVKLSSGMSSVTFSNGVKVNFDKLSSTDVSTKLKNDITTSNVADATTASPSSGSASTTLDLSTIVTAGQIAKGAGTSYSITIGGTDYSYTQKATDTSDDIMSGLVTALNATKPQVVNTGSVSNGTTLTLTATTAGGGSTSISLTDSNTNTSGAGGEYDFADMTVSAGTGSYAYVDTFGGKASTFDVDTKANAGLTFQVGANSGDELTINIDKMDSNYLGVASLNIGTQTGASAAISSVDKAINQVSSQRAYLGAIQNRLDHKIANLDTSNQNLTSAESEIRDVDMASEMTNFTNANILSQAATAMLAQANSLPKNVLSLLG